MPAGTARGVTSAVTTSYSGPPPPLAQPVPPDVRSAGRCACTNCWAVSIDTGRLKSRYRSNPVPRLWPGEDTAPGTGRWGRRRAPPGSTSPASRGRASAWASAVVPAAGTAGALEDLASWVRAGRPRLGPLAAAVRAGAPADPGRDAT